LVWGKAPLSVSARGDEWTSRQRQTSWHIPTPLAATMRQPTDHGTTGAGQPPCWETRNGARDGERQKKAPAGCLPGGRPMPLRRQAPVSVCRADLYLCGPGGRDGLCDSTPSRDKRHDGGDHAPNRSATHGPPREWTSRPIRPRTCQPLQLLPSLRSRT